MNIMVDNNVLKEIVEFADDMLESTDISGGINQDGRWYCKYCGKYDNHDDVVVHSNDCIYHSIQEFLANIG